MMRKVQRLEKTTQQENQFSNLADNHTKKEQKQKEEKVKVNMQYLYNHNIYKTPLIILTVTSRKPKPHKDNIEVNNHVCILCKEYKIDSIKYKNKRRRKRRK